MGKFVSLDNLERYNTNMKEYVNSVVDISPCDDEDIDNLFIDTPTGPVVWEGYDYGVGIIDIVTSDERAITEFNTLLSSIEQGETVTISSETDSPFVEYLKTIKDSGVSDWSDYEIDYPAEFTKDSETSFEITSPSSAWGYIRFDSELNKLRINRE